MVSSFAFNRDMSPITHLSTANIKRHEPAQYMGVCQFSSACIEHDSAKNYAPYLLFDGEVDSISAIDTKFPQNIDTVYFGKNKPKVSFCYFFDDAQMSQLSQQGYFTDGCALPDIFTAAKFSLELDVVVDEVTNTYENQKVPILNIGIMHPRDNTFDKSAYELADFFKRNPQTEEQKANKIYEQYIPAPEHDITSELDSLTNEFAQATASYVPLTKEQLALNAVDMRIRDAVAQAHERLTAERKINIARFAEETRIRKEQEALAAKIAAEEAERNIRFAELNNAVGEKIKDKDVIPVVSTDSELENNDTIFSNNTSDNVELSEKLDTFISTLQESNDENNAVISDNQIISDNFVENTSNKNKDDNNSGNTGTQGLGGYTFEDTDTAQYEMRADEGKGNEKLETTSSEPNVSSSDKAKKFTSTNTNTVFKNNTEDDIQFNK